MAESSQIDGALNFRDLGGLPTYDGRRLQRGLIYRSGSLHGLTDAGMAQFAALGVTAIYDLRSDPERASRPPRLPSNGAVEHLYHPHERETGNLFAALREPGRSASDGREVMLRIYRHLPFDLIPPYSQLFRRILHGPLPIVFNCAAGKDRTGFAAALLLRALGVSAEIALDDYLQSLQALDEIRSMFTSGPRRELVSGVDPAIWEPILRVDPLYLQTSFTAIETRCGSIEDYLHDALGISAADLLVLRESLLE